MGLQSVCTGITAPKCRLSSNPLLSHDPHHQISSACHFGTRHQSIDLGISRKLSLKNKAKGTCFLNFKRGGVVCASSFGGMEPFKGKSGSVSFYGLTHQSVEEGKLVSAPFDEDKGSFLWVLGPVALTLALIVPQFFLSNAIEAYLKDTLLVEIAASLSFEGIFYVGLAIFLLIADRIQRPYLEFSSKRWGLITGLRGYLTSSFFAMGIKVIIPLVVVYASWPVLGLPALVSVLPFLVGCLAQRGFEATVENRRSSCWPLVPIIFEVYRLFQLTKAAHFIEKMMFAMRGRPESAQLLERSNSLFAMLVTFQILGVVCLWSLMTFLLRLFPSRPVAENY